MHDATLPVWDHTTQLLRREAPEDATPVATEEARDRIEAQVLKRLEHPALVPPDELREAIALVTRWRASRAAPALVELLGYARVATVAADALVAIGPLAVRPVVRALRPGHPALREVIDVAEQLINASGRDADAWRYRADTAYFALCDRLHRLLLDSHTPDTELTAAATVLATHGYRGAWHTIDALYTGGFIDWAQEQYGAHQARVGAS